MGLSSAESGYVLSVSEQLLYSKHSGCWRHMGLQKMSSDVSRSSAGCNHREGVFKCLIKLFQPLCRESTPVL